MRMKHIILTAILTITALTLCGCRRNTIDIEADIPEGDSIDILVKIDETDEDYCDRYAEVLKEAEENIARQYEVEYNIQRRDETLAIMDSPRYKYCEDGWRSAYFFCPDVHWVSGTGLDYKNSDEESTVEFADRFGSIKIMEYSPNGIVNVSNEVVIAPKDKFGVGKYISYSSQTGTADCDKLIYRKWHGMTPSDPLIIELLLVLPCWIIFIVMLIVMRKKYQPSGSPDGWIVGASLLSVPNVTFTINALALKLVPYFNINNSRFVSGDLAGLALVDLPWALCIFGFVMIVRKNPMRPDPADGVTGA
ncbi:hypothetical protein SAMN02910447_00173 [Ruminococcus sp. YE71]|nr:hypothetical protein [Ruminococcus sp. YE78]SDA09708.1 hypothetical protein SAMN02910446_00176 [Ruminococcus sp. YE78]SFW11552.1 hypothetical protein SAMN02910447_00173 [Ruminococcus sp. YE71]